MVIPLIEIDVDVDIRSSFKKYIEQSQAVQPLFKSV